LDYILFLTYPSDKDTTKAVNDALLSCIHVTDYKSLSDYLSFLQLGNISPNIILTTYNQFLINIKKN